MAESNSTQDLLYYKNTVTSVLDNYIKELDEAIKEVDENDYNFTALKDVFSKDKM